MTSRTQTVTDPDEWDPEMYGDRPQRWETGTALDEFIDIYRALAMPTKTHGPLPPSEVDAMDMTIVAVLMGVGASDDLAATHADWRAEWEAEYGPVGAVTSAV